MRTEKELPAGCTGCQSTLPCRETCGGDPFVERDKGDVMPDTYNADRVYHFDAPGLFGANIRTSRSVADIVRFMRDKYAKIAAVTPHEAGRLNVLTDKELVDDYIIVNFAYTKS